MTKAASSPPPSSSRDSSLSSPDLSPRLPSLLDPTMEGQIAEKIQLSNNLYVQLWARIFFALLPFSNYGCVVKNVFVLSSSYYKFYALKTLK